MAIGWKKRPRKTDKEIRFSIYFKQKEINIDKNYAISKG